MNIELVYYEWEQDFHFMPEEQLRIAVFIDFDNIEIGVRSTMNKDFDVVPVLEALKERGEVISKIAYGNWKRHGNASRMMSEQAVQMVQRDPTPRGDKNGADINLALDALEMAFTKPHINAYTIVGGDSDFIALVEKLKQYNKAVFVVGGRGFTSAILQKNCREFISYENLMRQPEPARQPRAASRRPTRRGEPLPPENALPLLDRALKLLAEREHKPLLGLVKSTMLQLDSTFSERDYGSGSFLDFAQKLANAGLIGLERFDSNYAIKLPEARPAPALPATPPVRRGGIGLVAAAPAAQPETPVTSPEDISTPPPHEIAAAPQGEPAPPAAQTRGRRRTRRPAARKTSPRQLAAEPPKENAIVTGPAAQAAEAAGAATATPEPVGEVVPAPPAETSPAPAPRRSPPRRRRSKQ